MQKVLTGVAIALLLAGCGAKPIGSALIQQPTALTARATAGVYQITGATRTATPANSPYADIDYRFMGFTAAGSTRTAWSLDVYVNPGQTPRLGVSVSWNNDAPDDALSVLTTSQFAPGVDRGIVEGALDALKAAANDPAPPAPVNPPQPGCVHRFPPPCGVG